MQAEGNAYDVAQITNNIGLTNIYRGDREQALADWRAAADSFRELDEWSSELLALQNIAAANAEQGLLDSAIRDLKRIREILPPGKEPQLRATTLDNLGYAYRVFGRFDRALETFQEALTAFERARRPEWPGESPDTSRGNISVNRRNPARRGVLQTGITGRQNIRQRRIGFRQPQGARQHRLSGWAARRCAARSPQCAAGN